MLEIESVRREPEAGLPQIDGTVLYEVSVIAEDFGRILRTWGSSPTPRGVRCYELIHGRTGPCAGCPAMETIPVGGSVTAIVPGRDPSILHLVSVRRVGEGRALVSGRAVTEDLVRDLVRARIDRLALRAGLSEREREVLSLILLGRASEDIAHVLGISARTVKFHQTNALQKLGAESKLDLLRLLL